MSLTLYIRYEQLDTQKSVPTGFLRSPASEQTIFTYGVQFRPAPQTVIKWDFQNSITKQAPDSTSGTSASATSLTVPVPSPRGSGGGAGRARVGDCCVSRRALVFFAFSARPRLHDAAAGPRERVPRRTKVTREVVYLTPQEIDAARKRAASTFRQDDRPLRQQPASRTSTRIACARCRTVMIVVTPDGRIDKIEILSFDEPPEYLPKPRWIEQFRNRRLDEDLSTKRAIRPLSGATLSGRAITNASRKILALHRAIGAAEVSRPQLPGCTSPSR
jgi:hypothetical protein